MGLQLDVEQVIASAEADTVERALAQVAAANSRLYAARASVQAAERELYNAIVAARHAGASVRRIAPVAGMGKTKVAEIARYGEPGW